MVSLYHQVTGRMSDVFAFSDGLSEFLRHPYFGAHTLREFSDQWRQLCKQGIALPVTYEECTTDLPGVLRRVLEHYDLPFTRDAVEHASERASFERMKAVEDSGTFPDPWLRRRNGASKMRRGVVGSHRTELTDSDLKYLAAVFAPDEPVQAVRP